MSNSVYTADATRTAPSGRLGIGLLSSVLGLLGLLCGLFTLVHPSNGVIVFTSLAYGIITAILIWYGSRSVYDPRPVAAPAPSLVIAIATILALVIAFVVLEAFPNSADEFGYTYLADTLRHHRLWNASFPGNLHDVLMTVYLPDHDGKRVSQYPPGWPTILALLPSLRLSAIANPILGLISAVFLLLSLKELRIPGRLTAALLVLALLAPFTLFNNSSFYNHTLAGTCLIAIVYLDLRQHRVRSFWNQLGIGVAFSILLTNRYEVFMLAFITYALDGLVRRRGEFIKASMITALGALPITLLFGYYNWKITGSPLTTTLAWGAPNISYGLHATGMDGPNTPAKALEHTGRYVMGWSEFASVAILPFYVAALWRRVASRTIRWYDAMLPAIVLFFVFYPDGGGFQYGPRYWFAGWVLLPLTLATGFADGGPWIFGRWSIDPVRLALLQGASYIGFTVGFAIFAHIQVDVRRAPLLAAARAPEPAVVLFAEYPVRYVPWQIETVTLQPVDYTRNGADGLGPVILARNLGPERTALLCKQISGRTIWRLDYTGSPPVARLKPAC